MPPLLRCALNSTSVEPYPFVKSPNQKLFQENPDFWWMGFARSAVTNSIFPAFIVIDTSEDALDVYGRYLSLFLNRPHILDEIISASSGPLNLATFLLPNDGLSGLLAAGSEPELIAVLEGIDTGTITTDDIHALSNEFTQMQYDIFMHIGALHYAYTEGGIELIRKMGEKGEIDLTLVNAFENIERGDESSLAEAARIMAEYEQGEIIQRNYLRIADMNDAGPLLLGAMSVMTVPAVPGGISLRARVENGHIENIYGSSSKSVVK